ncbi:hypothetical protein SDC9_112036 [bioreactor metagenome]|uniref:Uncharacterized protein n=1 Tax=bioreactor metagenome TaxID=1076179 RepID=A0A645BTL2_9ZZZZ
MHQVRGDGVEQQAALGEGLGVQVQVGLVEVAESAVDEPGGARRGAGRPVLHLDQAGAQASGDGVEGDPGAGDASADDEDVETGAVGHLRQGV